MMSRRSTTIQGYFSIMDFYTNKAPDKDSHTFPSLFDNYKVANG